MLSLVGVDFLSTMLASSSLRKIYIFASLSPIRIISSNLTFFFCFRSYPFTNGLFVTSKPVIWLTGLFCDLMIERIGINSAMLEDTEDDACF